MHSRHEEQQVSTAFPSRLEIASTLQPRAPEVLPALPASSVLSEPTSVFVGVDPKGEADYAFLMQSSGNGALDQKAEDFIRSVRFKPGPIRNWGVVTLHWGGTQP
jgi:TonB family protein